MVGNQRSCILLYFIGANSLNDDVTLKIDALFKSSTSMGQSNKSFSRENRIFWSKAGFNTRQLPFVVRCPLGKSNKNIQGILNTRTGELNFVDKISTRANQNTILQYLEKGLPKEKT